MNKIDRTGEINIANNGQKMTIIEYFNNKNMSIEFENGTIVTHKSYKEFKKGSIANPSYINPRKSSGKTKSLKYAETRIGEVNTMNCGFSAKIIAYRNCHDIDIEFEDGVIIKNRSYKEFRKGLIKNPTYNLLRKAQKPIKKEKPDLSKIRIGEIRLMNCGLKAKIIAYRGSKDIDIQFEDGTIIKHRRYSCFKTGGIAKVPNDSHVLECERLNEERIMNCGLKAKIIEYKNTKDIKVQFEDGITVSTTYANFKNGNIRNPNVKRIIKKASVSNNKNTTAKCKPSKETKELVGMTTIATNGQKMTIIRGDKKSDIDVRFEDGTIIRHRNFSNFKSGYIANPNISTIKYQYGNKYIGKSNRANNNQMMYIIDYKNYHNISVRFEDGTIVHNKCVKDFLLGTVENPNCKIFNGVSVNEMVLLYYFSKIGFVKKEYNKELEFGKYEYDLFNKDLKLAIEYDGDFRTHTIDKDIRKVKDAKKHGIDIWRVRLSYLPKLDDKENKIFSVHNKSQFNKELENICRKILSEINLLYKTNFIIDFNFKRDKKDILDFIEKEYYAKSNTRVGQTNIATNGQKMTIIKYYNSGDITIEFEDGTIVENRTYHLFKTGTIKNPNFKKQSSLTT